MNHGVALSSQYKKVTAPVFPRDVWGEILSFDQLDLPDFLSLAENSIWKSLASRRWPKAQVFQNTNNPHFWKHWYKIQNKIENNLRSTNVECVWTPCHWGTNWLKILESPLDDTAFCFTAKTAPAMDIKAHQLSFSKDSSLATETPFQTIDCLSDTQNYRCMDVDWEKFVLIHDNGSYVVPNSPVQHGTPVNMELATKIPVEGNCNAAALKGNLVAVADPTSGLAVWDLNTAQLLFSRDQTEQNVIKCYKMAWQTEDPGNQNIVAMWVSENSAIMNIYDPRSPSVVSQTHGNLSGCLIRNNIMATREDGGRAYNVISLYDLRYQKNPYATLASASGKTFTAFDFDSDLTRLVTLDAIGTMEFVSLHDGKQIEKIPYWAWHEGTTDTVDRPVLTCTSKYVCDRIVLWTYYTQIAIAQTRLDIVNLASVGNSWNNFPMYGPLPKERGISNAEMYYRIVQKRQQEGTLPFDTLEMLKDDSFSDLQIVTSEQVFRVHRCILAARSPVLAKTLKENNTGRLEWFEFPTAIYRNMLQWVYSGQCNVLGTLQERCLLLKLAHQLELKRLEQQILETISAENLLELLNMATELNVAPLMDVCIKSLKWSPLASYANETHLVALLNRMSQLEIMEDTPTKSFENTLDSTDVMDLTFPETSEFPVQSRPYESSTFILPTNSVQTKQKSWRSIISMTPNVPADWKIRAQVDNIQTIGVEHLDTHLIQKIFSLLLSDPSGKIAATTCKESVQALFRIGAVYEISGARIVPNETPFSSSTHHYELQLDSEGCVINHIPSLS